MRNQLIATTSFLSLLALPANAQIPTSPIDLPYSAQQPLNSLSFSPARISGNGAYVTGGESSFGPGSYGFVVWSFGRAGTISGSLDTENTEPNPWFGGINEISSDGRFIVGLTDQTAKKDSDDDEEASGLYGFLLDTGNGTEGRKILFEDLNIIDVNDLGNSVVANSKGNASWIHSINFDGSTYSEVELVGNQLGSSYTSVAAMDNAGTIAVGSAREESFSIGDDPESAVYWLLDSTKIVDGNIEATYFKTLDNFFGQEPPMGVDDMNLDDADAQPIPVSESAAIGISGNGRYIIGLQLDRMMYDDIKSDSEFISQSEILRSFVYDRNAALATGLTAIPGENASVRAISNTGIAVGDYDSEYSYKLESYDKSIKTPRQQAWVYDLGSAQFRSVSQWLSDAGINIVDTIFLTANDISDDGNIIIGTSVNAPTSQIPVVQLEAASPLSYEVITENMALSRPTGFIADIRRGVIGTEAYQQSSNEAAQQTASISSFMNTILNGSHHVPLQMQGAGRHAWTTADYARSDRYDTDSTLAEVGSAVDLMEKQLVAGLGVGQSWVDQGLSLGGDADLSGQYLVSELSYRAAGTPYIFSLTGVYGMWDADIDRNYLNGGAIATSRGETDVNSGSIRLRVDWLDAAKFLGFGITPKIEYAFNQTKTDSYTETGIFANSYDNQRESIHQTRYGLTAARNVLQDKGHVRLRFEGVHRFDDGKNISSATIVGINNTFDIVGQGAKQNWLLYGVDFDYALNEHVTLTSGIQSSTAGQDPIFGSSLGMRVSF